MNRPVMPAPISTAAMVEGVRPIMATIGIIMGAMIALAPARVPSRATRTIEVAIVARIAFFSVLTPIFFVNA